MRGASAEDRQDRSTSKLGRQNTDACDHLIVERHRPRQVFLQRQHLRWINSWDRHRPPEVRGNGPNAVSAPWDHETRSKLACLRVPPTYKRPSVVCKAARLAETFVSDVSWPPIHSRPAWLAARSIGPRPCHVRAEEGSVRSVARADDAGCNGPRAGPDRP